MKNPSLYDQHFFKGRSTQVQASAQVLVECMYKLFRPKSVIDVGCGDGAWLSEWSKRGVVKIKGVDGDWVDSQVLKISANDFESHDLNKPITIPERFDLCTSFEVAEHLAPENAHTFIQSLTRLGDLIVFSAAIPGQGGTGHLNEQWQDYWISQFDRCGYIALDLIAPLVWQAENVQSCYLQNTLVYVKREALAQYPQLGSLPPANISICGRRIHPRTWAEKIIEGQDLARFGGVALLRALPRALSNSISARIFRR